MTIRWIWICDGPGCDLRQELEGGQSSNVIRDQKVSMTHVGLWQGHLCDNCIRRAHEKIKAAFVDDKRAGEKP